MTATTQTPLPSRMRSDAGRPATVQRAAQNLAPPAGQGPDVQIEGAVRAYCPRCQTTGHYRTAHAAGTQ